LVIAQLVNKFPDLWKPEAQYCVLMSLPLVSVLTQMNPLHTPTPLLPQDPV